MQLLKQTYSAPNRPYQIQVKIIKNSCIYFTFNKMHINKFSLARNEFEVPGNAINATYSELTEKIYCEYLS